MSLRTAELDQLAQTSAAYERAAQAVTDAWPTGPAFTPLPEETDIITVREQTDHLWVIEAELTNRGVPVEITRLGFLTLHRQQPQPYGLWAENCAAAYAAVLDFDRREDAR